MAPPPPSPVVIRGGALVWAVATVLPSIPTNAMVQTGAPPWAAASITASGPLPAAGGGLIWILTGGVGPWVAAPVAGLGVGRAAVAPGTQADAASPRSRAAASRRMRLEGWWPHGWFVKCGKLGRLALVQAGGPPPHPGRPWAGAGFVEFTGGLFAVRYFFYRRNATTLNSNEGMAHRL